MGVHRFKHVSAEIVGLGSFVASLRGEAGRSEFAGLRPQPSGAVRGVDRLRLRVGAFVGGLRGAQDGIVRIRSPGLRHGHRSTPIRGLPGRRERRR